MRVGRSRSSTSTPAPAGAGTHDPLAAAAAEALATRTRSETHDIALVLGSGWASAADLLGEVVAEVPTTHLPGFAPAAVPGHVGRVRSVRIGSTHRRALVFLSRTHLYEGRGVRPVVHSVRTAALAGCSTVVLTNGAGGLRPEWGPGTPVLISDHINLTGLSPVEGATFADLTDLYRARGHRRARSRPRSPRNLPGHQSGRRHRRGGLGPRGSAGGRSCRGGTMRHHARRGGTPDR